MADQPAPTVWHQLPGAPAPGTVISHLNALTDATAHRTPGPFSLILLREGDTVKAYVNRCAHFGVPLAAAGFPILQVPLTSIQCNVHYAQYRWSDGSCLSGDCDGDALLPVPVTVRADGCVCIA